jgi:hypothetical protein
VYDAQTRKRPCGCGCYELMLPVRIQGHNHRVTNKTLDRLFGVDSWRGIDRALLQNTIREHHRAGRLVIDRQRLRLASSLEEAESRLRAEQSRDEILRSGFRRIASGLTQIAEEIRGLPAWTRRQLQARLRSARPEAGDAFVLVVEERIISARPDAVAARSRDRGNTGRYGLPLERPPLRPSSRDRLVGQHRQGIDGQAYWRIGRPTG